MSLPPFPVDEQSLDLLWDAIYPDPSAESSSLFATLDMFSEMGGSDLNAVDVMEIAVDVKVMRDPMYSPDDALAALITEVRRLRRQGATVKPSVGRIVHYVSYGTPGGEYTSQCRAAVIAGVPEGVLPVILAEGVAAQCDLVVLNPTGLFFNRCPQDEQGKTGGTWHWPERVDD